MDCTAFFKNIYGTDLEQSYMRNQLGILTKQLLLTPLAAEIGPNTLLIMIKKAAQLHSLQEWEQLHSSF